MLKELHQLADDGCPHADDLHTVLQEPVPRDELVRMLRNVEWIDSDRPIGYYCPECMNWNWDGHTQGCLLHRAITEG